jgi:hypothetical protein
MKAKKKTAFLALVLAIAASAIPASAAGVTAMYDLRDAGIEAIDEVGSFTLTVNGISASLTALAGGVTNAGTVLNRTASGFGVNALGSGDATDQIDFINGIESVRIAFSEDVFFTQLVLSVYSTQTQSPPTGDLASLALPAGTVFPLPMSSATDTYNFSTNNFVAAGQTVELSYVQGNGFSFDSFTVNSVPLPSVASAGLILLGALASARFLRRR